MRAELTGLEEQLVHALHQMELYFPAHFMFIKTHNMVHMVEKIRMVGPLYITSMFPHERSYKQLRSWIKSTVHPVASLAQNVVAFNMSVLYQASRSSDTPIHHMASVFDVPAATDSMGEDGAPANANASDAMLLSPYTVTAAGDWSIETGIGRKQSVSSSTVEEGSSEYLKLHRLFLESNSPYRDLYIQFLEDGYLDELHADKRLPAEAAGAGDDADVLQRFMWHLWGEDRQRAALVAWRRWGNQQQPPLPAAARRMCTMPPIAYLPQFEIRIGGQPALKVAAAGIFSGNGIATTQLHKIRDSIVLRGTHAAAGTLFFGVLTHVRMFRTPGAALSVGDMSAYDQPVLTVKWLMLPSQAGSRIDAGVGVPVLCAQAGNLQCMPTMQVGSTFTAADLVHAQDIIPTTHVLVPSTSTANKVLVLHRDPSIAQLSRFERTFITR